MLRIRSPTLTMKHAVTSVLLICGGGVTDLGLPGHVSHLRSEGTRQLWQPCMPAAVEPHCQLGGTVPYAALRKNSCREKSEFGRLLELIGTVRIVMDEVVAAEMCEVTGGICHRPERETIAELVLYPASTFR